MAYHKKNTSAETKAQEEENRLGKLKLPAPADLVRRQFQPSQGVESHEARFQLSRILMQEIWVPYL